jgi:hypothetical protein
MAARRSSLGHSDLAARPGPLELDRAPRAFVAWSRSLEVVQHVLRAVGRPDRQPAVVGVFERSTPADGDEPRVADVVHDH